MGCPVNINKPQTIIYHINIIIWQSALPIYEITNELDFTLLIQSNIKESFATIHVYTLISLKTRLAWNPPIIWI